MFRTWLNRKSNIPYANASSLHAPSRLKLIFGERHIRHIESIGSFSEFSALKTLEVSGELLIGSKELLTDEMVDDTSPRTMSPITMVYQIFNLSLKHFGIDHPGDEVAFIMPLLAKIAARRKGGHILPNPRTLDLQWWSKRHKEIEMMDLIEADFLDVGVEIKRPHSFDYEDEGSEGYGYYGDDTGMMNGDEDEAEA